MPQPPKRHTRARILCWTDLEAAKRVEIRPKLEAIALETAGTRNFESPTARNAFVDFWMGQYLDAAPTLSFVALGPTPHVLGYAVGWPYTPPQSARFAPLTYLAAFSEQLQDYPAHLHINLTASARNQGLGSRLVATLVSRLQDQGCAGVHVVIGSGAHNQTFYGRNLFHPVASCLWHERKLVFLGRDLSHSRRTD